MANRAKFLAAKERMRTKLLKVIDDCEQLARDIAWWNANRTDAPPFDLGGDLIVARLARELLSLVEAEKPIPDAMWNRFTKQVEANARAKERAE